MFTAIGSLVIRRRRAVLVASVGLLVLAGIVGAGVFSRLDGGGFDAPDAESTRAAVELEERFDTGQPNYIVLVDVDPGATADDGTVGGTDVTGDRTVAVDSAEVVEEAEMAFGELEADPVVAEVVSYWSVGQLAPLRSDDGTAALMLARLDGTENEVSTAVERLDEEFLGERGPITLTAGGESPVFADVSHLIESDLARAEAIAIPVTLILLVIVFGGLVAAGLPLLTGASAVLGTFFTLYVISLVTDVSVFSINLVTAMGLGLAIDYSLFVVSRFREELRARPRDWWGPEDRRQVDAALVKTIETAGRTVLFSAVTVAISLAALLVFPLYFLRSFAYAGIGVTLVAAMASVFTLPAVLAVLGRRVDSLQFVKRRPQPTEADIAHGWWYRMARWVMARAGRVAVAVVALLLLLGVPFLSVQFGTPDERVMPEGEAARVATERVRAEFSSPEADAFPIVVLGDVADGALTTYAEDLSSVDGVTRVDAANGRYVDGTRVLGPDPLLDGYRVESATRLSVVPDIEPVSAEGEQLVADVRAVSAPGDALVGGQSAGLVDSKDVIGQRLPWALGWIALATFVLLFLMFGSVVVPLKAIVLNILSLTATFGAMVWVFQWGNGAGLLGFTATGLTDTTTPILMFCIAFGLSMDYEVFLLSRIKEEYDRSGDNERSVAVGLQRTGGIVTAAAALLAVTFLAFSTSSITFVKLFGLGLALAVLMDATLVRATLVPAFMRLAGDANWWAPAWMRSIYDRFGISEAEPPVVGDLTEGGVGPDSGDPGSPLVVAGDDDSSSVGNELETVGS